MNPIEKQILITRDFVVDDHIYDGEGRGTGRVGCSSGLNVTYRRGKLGGLPPECRQAFTLCRSGLCLWSAPTCRRFCSRHSRDFCRRLVAALTLR